MRGRCEKRSVLCQTLEATAGRARNLVIDRQCQYRSVVTAAPPVRSERGSERWSVRGLNPSSSRRARTAAAASKRAIPVSWNDALAPQTSMQRERRALTLHGDRDPLVNPSQPGDFRSTKGHSLLERPALRNMHGSVPEPRG